MGAKTGGPTNGPRPSVAGTAYKAAGIEPTSPGWSTRPESNRPTPAWQAGAPPLGLRVHGASPRYRTEPSASSGRRFHLVSLRGKLAGREGVEPSRREIWSLAGHRDLRPIVGSGRRGAHWALPTKGQPDARRRPRTLAPAPGAGIEPAMSQLTVGRLATWLSWNETRAGRLATARSRARNNPIPLSENFWLAGSHGDAGGDRTLESPG